MNRLKEKFHLNITNIMFWLSGTFIVICMIGLVMSPYISKKMKNDNYLFTDSEDMQLFETALEDNEVPYTELSKMLYQYPLIGMIWEQKCIRTVLTKMAGLPG